MSAPLLADPRETFLAQDPSVLRDPNALLDPDQIPQTTWEQLPADHGQYRTLTDVAVGIGASYLLLARLFGQQLRIRPSGWQTSYILSSGTLQASLEHATGSYRNAWTYMLNPAISHAMTLGTAENLSYEDQVRFATVFSHQIFDYINKTNANALVAGYEAQLTDKWNPDVAWARSVAGYGLDERSMRQYIKMATQGEAREVIPHAARIYVQRQLGDRAKKLGYNESFRAQELGKTLVWMTQYSKGQLPTDTQREWLTAEDERVCKVCGPMDHVAVPVMEQFELPDGNKLWAPGVHPNCRCSVRLTYPEMVQKTESGETRRRASADQPRTLGRFGNRVEELEAPAEEQVAEPQVVTEAPTRAGTVTQAPTRGAITAAPTRPVTEAPTKPVTEAPVRQAEAVTAAPTRTGPITQAPTKAATQIPTKTGAPVKRAPVKPEAGTSHFLRPRHPMYIWANDLDQRVAQSGRVFWQGNRDYDVGDPVDLTTYAEYQDRKSNAPVMGMPAKALPLARDLAYEASDMYGDLDAFSEWDRTDYGKTAYHRAAQDFYTRAKRNVNLIVDPPGFTKNDLIAIYHMAGDDLSPRVLDTNTLKENLKRSVETDGPLRDPYLHYMETAKYTSVPGWQEFKDMEYAMPKDPHVPVALIFAGGAYGVYLGDLKNAVLTGKYKVQRSEIISTKLDMGTDTPSNIAAIKLVYLEPDNNRITEPEWSGHG